MCSFLGNIYKEVFGTDFVYSSGIETRMKMQKAVYLLERMGMSVDDYNFIWYKHGPYSQRLQDDACKIRPSSIKPVEFTKSARENLSKLKTLVSLHSETGYSATYWLEAIASLDFLTTRKCMDEKKALESLKEVKPHLNDDAANRKALSEWRKLCA